MSRRKETYIRSLPQAVVTGQLYTSRLAMRVFDRHECTKILDVGCGDAYFESQYPDRFFGIDVEINRLRTAAESGVDRLVNGSGLELPFDDSAFDGILSKDFIEHLYLEEAFAFLHEVKRTLVPGGIFVTVTFKSTQRFWDKPDHVRPYSNKWVRRVMVREMRGFRVVLERDLSAGIRGFGRLRLEWLAHALAHWLHFRSDHGLIALQKLPR